MKLEIRKGPALLLGIVGLLLAAAAWKLGGEANLSSRTLMASCVVFALCGWFRLRTSLRPLQPTAELVWAAAGLPLCFVLTQRLMESTALTMKPERILLGMLVVAVFLLALYVVLGSIRWSVILGQIALLFLSTANSFIYLFRGNELIPADFTSFTTAMNVAGGYEYNITPAMYRSWILLLAYCWASLILPRWQRPVVEVPAKAEGKPLRKKKQYTKTDAILAIGSRVLALVLAVVVGAGVMQYGRNGEHINIRRFRRQGTDTNGFLLNFYLRIPEMIPVKPASYGKDQISALEKRIEAELSDADTTTKQKMPTIIAIMDESFADISVRNPDGILNTTEEVLPFLNSLEENVIKGHALCSVYGGNTPNSEYEFLTGHSQAWNPTGTISYQNDVRDGDYSIVKVLHDLGYTCTAMHPYKASGWKRPTVYPAFGFDDALFRDQFDKNNIFRFFISDEEMFNKIISLYEEQKDTPQFYFGVTIQNHGDYKYKNFENTVKQVGYEKGSKRVDQYLTLVHETDRALGEFINYFSQVEDEVVVVFFGDHQAHIGEGFYNELHGGELETLDEKQLQYTVPFFIWANYDIEEQQVECTSLNYLSSMMMDVAGLPRAPYQQFLMDLQQTIPAINQFGYYSLTEGCYKELSDAEGDEAQALEEYATLQYNDIHDRKNSSEYFFPSSN